MTRRLALWAALTVTGCDCFGEAYTAYSCRDAGACDGGGGAGGGGNEIDVTMGFSGDDALVAGTCGMAAATFSGQGSRLRDIDVELGFDGGPQSGRVYDSREACNAGGTERTRFVAPAALPSMGFGFQPLEVGILGIEGTGNNDAGVSVRATRLIISRAESVAFEPPVIVTDGGCVRVEVRLRGLMGNSLIAGSELALDVSSGDGVTVGLGPVAVCTAPVVQLRWQKGELARAELWVGRPAGSTPLALLTRPGDAGAPALANAYVSALVWHGCLGPAAMGCSTTAACCSGSCDGGMCD